MMFGSKRARILALEIALGVYLGVLGLGALTDNSLLMNWATRLYTIFLGTWVLVDLFREYRNKKGGRP